MHNHRIETRLGPDLSGIETPSFKSRLLRLFVGRLKPGTALPVLSGPLRGARWILDAGDPACWTGGYQREIQARFAGAVAPGSAVLILGDKAGFYSLLASRRAGREGRVFVFEPLPRPLDLLRRHLALNKVANAQVIEAAVSYKNGSAFLDPGPDGKTARLAAAGQFQVRTCTLDRMLAEGELPLPQALKIDIGGAEFGALCGAKDLLRRARPAVFLSTHGERVHRECCAFLDMLGYRLEALDGQDLEDSRQLVATHI